MIDAENFNKTFGVLGTPLSKEAEIIPVSVVMESEVEYLLGQQVKLKKTKPQQVLLEDPDIPDIPGIIQPSTTLNSDLSFLWEDPFDRYRI